MKIYTYKENNGDTSFLVTNGSLAISIESAKISPNTKVEDLPIGLLEEVKSLVGNTKFDNFNDSILYRIDTSKEYLGYSLCHTSWEYYETEYKPVLLTDDEMIEGINLMELL